MHGLPEAPTMSAELARIDYRTTPEYYIDTAQVTDPLVLHLLSCCPTVFGLKKAMADLMAGRLDLALPESAGMIEPGATVRGQVVVAAGAVIAEGARMVTGPHPGFPTDVQPLLTAFLTQARGTSRIEERVYTQRGSHAEPLRALGAHVNADGQLITVRGRTPLTGADVAGEDIRAVTALVIAALAAEGTSTIRGMYHLRRGYSCLLPKLAALGAELTIDQENA
jgi:hypothetical protein